MIFLTLLAAGALAGLALTRARDKLVAAQTGAAAAFVAGGLWVGLVAPAARAFDPGALAVGTGAAGAAVVAKDAVSTPLVRGRGRGNIVLRSGGAPSPASVRPPGSDRSPSLRASGARHRVPDAS